MRELCLLMFKLLTSQKKPKNCCFFFKISVGITKKFEDKYGLGQSGKNINKCGGI